MIILVIVYLKKQETLDERILHIKPKLAFIKFQSRIIVIRHKFD